MIRMNPTANPHGPHTDQAARDVLNDFGLVERTSERKLSDE